MAGIARLTALTVVSSGLTAALYAEPSFSQTSPSSVKVAQEAEAASSQAQAPFPPELPPGGTSIEDLLLQKGTITMDEWIQIRSEQEYKVADQTKRLDSLEDWKQKTEMLPMLRDKVNFGLNALQFLYGHVDAHVPEGKSQDSLSIRRSEIV